MGILVKSFVLVLFLSIQMVWSHSYRDDKYLYSKNMNVSIASENEFVFAHVVFRHGNRNILYTYETDPYKDERFWPNGYGALTNTGKRTEYELGKHLRRRYDRNIGPDYSRYQVYVRSSNVDRTLMSGACAMAGLFPPSGIHVWKTNLNWQPIPIHTVPLEEDYLVYQGLDCPTADKAFQQYLMGPEIESLLKQNSGLLQYLERNSGMPVRSLKDVAAFYEGLTKEKEAGLPLPDWAYNVLRSPTLGYLTSFGFAGVTRTTEMKKVRSGFLLKEMLERFAQKARGTLDPDRTLYIYSAHDNTIVNLLNSLNVYDVRRYPPYGASVYLELYRRDSKHYVQLFYRTGPSDEVPPIEIPNCGTLCPLEKFYYLYKNILPTDKETYDSLCGLEGSKKMNDNLQRSNSLSNF